jgi:hypothetical protein
LREPNQNDQQNRNLYNFIDVLKHIYLITKSGPEWNDPIKAFKSKKKAEIEAVKMNGLPKAGIDTLSNFEVSEVPIDHEE